MNKAFHFDCELYTLYLSLFKHVLKLKRKAH